MAMTAKLASFSLMKARVGVVEATRRISSCSSDRLWCKELVNGNFVPQLMPNPAVLRRRPLAVTTVRAAASSSIAEQHLGVEARTRRIAPDATKVDAAHPARLRN